MIGRPRRRHKSTPLEELLSPQVGSDPVSLRAEFKDCAISSIRQNHLEQLPIDFEALQIVLKVMVTEVG